jgi:hypothetical protein
VACLLEPKVRELLWAELRAGRTPQQALAAAGVEGAEEIEDATQLPPAAELPEGAAS